MKLMLWMLLIAFAVAAPSFGSSAFLTADRYFAIRQQANASALQASQAAISPETYIGRTIELKGTVTGSAVSATSVSIIIETDDGTHIVNTTDDPAISSGSTVRMLVEIGDKCRLSLTDLRLKALIYECDAAARERKIAEAEAAAQKAKAAALAARQKKAEMLARAKRVQQTTSRAPVAYSGNDIIAIYRRAIKGFNPRLSDTDADVMARCVIGFSQKYQVDPRLVVAVILAESHFNPNATSRCGAMGLGQLMPGTAAGLGVSNAYNPIENIGASVRLIKGHLDKLSGGAAWNDLTWHDLSLALASYNAGPGAVKKYGGVPPYRETQAYIKTVVSNYKRLCGQK